MPIDINHLRAEKGGNPEAWREHCRKRLCVPPRAPTPSAVAPRPPLASAARALTGRRRPRSLSHPAPPSAASPWSSWTM